MKKLGTVIKRFLKRIFNFISRIFSIIFLSNLKKSIEDHIDSSIQTQTKRLEDHINDMTWDRCVRLENNINFLRGRSNEIFQLLVDQAHLRNLVPYTGGGYREGQDRFPFSGRLFLAVMGELL